MVLIGLVLGLLLKPSAVGPASTMTLLVVAMLGGLWFPLEMFPAIAQGIGRATPAFWIAEYPRTVFAGGELDPRGLLVIGAWMLALATVGALSYRRAISTSKR
jgi:ABC-2 type transport system permease protein